MHYYEHHLADYTQATAHLSMLEDAAYSRMLRWYYANEKPLSSDIKQVERLVRAQTKLEREAVKTVLEEFFILTNNAYHQDRADREIARYQDKQRKATASANARWNNNKSHTDGNANAYANASETHSDGNAPHTPITNHQTKTPVLNTPEVINTTLPSKAGEVCIAIRSEGIISTNTSHPDLIALLEVGAEVQEFVDAARLAKERGKGFAYVLGIVKGQRADSDRQPGKLNGKGSIHDQRAATIAELTGANRHDASIIDGTAHEVG